jgi:hypothetical protein
MTVAVKTRRPATLDHLKKKKPVQKTISLILEDQPLLDYEAAVEAYQKVSYDYASLPDSPEKAKKLKDAQKKIDEKKAVLDEVTVELTLRAIGSKAYDDLLLEYPNPKDEEERTDQDPVYDPATFPIALVAASLIEPKVTFDELKELWDDWNVAEVTDLFFTAMSVNTSRRVVDMGKGYGSTRN